jgi:GAF domain-containing protein
MKTEIVPNVHEYPGHIACSDLTNSEIVVPLIRNNQCLGVLDLDSEKFDNYDVEDAKLLEAVVKEIVHLIK